MPTVGSPTRRRAIKPPREVAAQVGLVLEEPLSGWVGALIRVAKTAGMSVVVLEDARGRTRTFPFDDEFWVDGQPVRLTRAAATASASHGSALAAKKAPRITASGSVAAPTGGRAKVARPSRIWVEGRHDAELVERVWGADLRDVGVVVELLDGVDHLAERLAEFGPTPQARVGVLVDHLITGTKESRLVADATASYGNESVLVTGHKFVDIWQAVKPERLGLREWPNIPRNVEWKVGMLAALGWPHATQTDIANGWHRILSKVRNYQDLEPSLLGPVEHLIDFVTT